MLCTPDSLAHMCHPTEERRESSSTLQDAVRRVFAATHHAQRGQERRRQHRTPYPYLIKLAPVAADGHTPAGDGIVVVGKHLSQGGIDFYQRDPHPYRWAIAWLETSQKTSQAILLELLWCRFNKKGWYENGGRFVRVLDAT